ncbi:hypothetical protein NL676_022230 [Syzygium grande]|nr:hypothetical protein NL676_022230 [Syzygium grande]
MERVVAKEAARQNIPILLDAEKKRPGLDDLLDLSDYVVCSAKFPQAWTEAPSMPSALISMLLRLPKLKFAIVTLGGTWMPDAGEIIRSGEPSVERRRCR